ncbi:MAG: hypothetical protein IJF67_10035 [Clostridia bacterium]|nr:hypothetical protein [Clostridia bacterium]
MTEAGYDYPDVDFGGYEFKVLNFSDFYNCYLRLALDEMTGETVDDAVFNRNRRVEEKLNFKMVEIIEEFGGAWGNNSNIYNKLQASILADDNAYDAAYTGLPFSRGLITDGYLVDLYTIPELQLDEEWWDVSLNKPLELNGKLYAATSPLQLSSLGLTWVLLFNKEMLDKYKLEYPYDIVRDGKWTLDKLNEYLGTTKNLNGDDSFEFNGTGNSVYGIAAHKTTAAYMLMISAGNPLISQDTSGKLVYNGVDEHFYSTVDKLMGVLNYPSGNTYFSDTDSLTDPTSYYYLFSNNRSAFITTELKGTSRLRDMKADYGILPAPKYDENQKEYISFASENIHRLVIPVTNDDLSRTGLILDALSFESKRDVLPLYYNQTISQKGLRDEDSIEMLDLINDTRMTEVGKIFGITTALVDSVSTAIREGNKEVASIVASAETAVKANLEKLLEAIK